VTKRYHGPCTWTQTDDTSIVEKGEAEVVIASDRIGLDVAWPGGTKYQFTLKPHHGQWVIEPPKSVPLPARLALTSVNETDDGCSLGGPWLEDGVHWTFEARLQRLLEDDHSVNDDDVTARARRDRE
jgi:hypothetical protein